MRAFYDREPEVLAVEKPKPAEHLTTKAAAQSKGTPRAQQHEEALEEMQRFIIDFWGEHHYPPTMREIMAALDISSLSVVSYRLDELERDGYISRIRRVSRGIVPNPHARLAARKSRAKTTG